MAYFCNNSNGPLGFVRGNFLTNCLRKTLYHVVHGPAYIAICGCCVSLMLRHSLCLSFGGTGCVLKYRLAFCNVELLLYDIEEAWEI
jgi:hypothetical protein